jgi:hypothetical protein
VSKEEVLLLMNEVVNHFNRQIGKDNNLSDSQIDEIIMNHQETLSYINGMLYEELVNHGVIN